MDNILPFHIPDRLMDAPLLKFNLEEIIEKIKKEDLWKMGERDAITLLKSAYMRIVLIALHEQTAMNFLQSGNMISVQIMEGSVTIQTDKKSAILKKGSLLTLHEDTKHSLIAMEASIFLLTIAICPASPE
jgi:quercetin dioxygenase-like cupin family protein